MYQVIARKYRPAAFSELVSQEHVRTTLENAITQRRIAHGYILSGQRGTGKTTVARIIARCLNCIAGPTATPCGECASCREIAAGSSPDVIEIDAASNRGINEMRELRDNVRYRPARDRYKVFIIDEAHQITSEAFNALLKTLEEPPEWVVFILCTTESHKIPTTIASRCQQFSFRSVPFDELIGRMKWICEQEGIRAEEDAFAVLARAGEGSVRDSLSALDQAIACCGTELRADELRTLLGMFPAELLHEVTTALSASDGGRMLEIVQELEQNGRSLQHFCRELSKFFRNLLVARVAGKETRLIGASQPEQERLRETAAQFSEEDLTRFLGLTLELFKDMQASLQPRLHLEMGLLRLVHAGRLRPIEELLSGSGGAPITPKASASKAAPPKPPAAQARSGPPPSATNPERKAAPEPANADWKSRIHAALTELKMAFTADAVEHSSVTEQNGELIFVTAKEFSLAMNEGDLRRAAQHAAGKPVRVKVAIGDPGPQPVEALKEAPRGEDDAMERALQHPDVQRFQQKFPDAQIRTVRNLKE